MTAVMTKPQMTYFGTEDILHSLISEEDEARSVELAAGITAELNETGDLIGVEILNASQFIRDTVLESVQAKVLALAS